MSTKVMTQDSNLEKAKWNAESIEIFLDLCVEEVKAGNRPGTHFNRLGWLNLVKKFQDKTKKNYDKMKLKNKWDNLKTTWKEWDTLVGKETGLGWDYEKKTIQASAEWWEKKIKENPNVEKFREKGLQFRDQMEICFKDVVATGEHAWAPSSGVLPDGMQGSKWFQEEQPYEFDTPLSCNEEFVDGNGLENNLGDSFEQTNLEESNVIGKQGVNESGDKRKRKATTNMNEKRKLNTGLRITSSIERIAEAMEARSSMNMGSKDNSLSIKSVMDIVRNLPGMIVGSDLWWKASILLVKQPMREIFLAQDDPELQLQWLEKMSEIHKE